MKTYDLTYILTPEITSEEAEAFAKEIETFVQSKEGTVVKHLNPVAKTLSYQIKKHASGFIGSIEFILEPEALLELKQKMGKNAKVNRHMIIIKHPARKEKIRRSRNKVEDETITEKETTKEITIENKKIVENSSAEVEKPLIQETKAEETKKEDKKVELKDIEQKLEELLGE